MAHHGLLGGVDERRLILQQWRPVTVPCGLRRGRDPAHDHSLLGARRRVEDRLRSAKSDEQQLKSIEEAAKAVHDAAISKRRAAAAQRARDFERDNRRAVAVAPCCAQRLRAARRAATADGGRGRALAALCARERLVNSEFARALQKSEDAARLRRLRDAALCALVTERAWRAARVDARAWRAFAAHARFAEPLMTALSAARAARTHARLNFLARVVTKFVRAVARARACARAAALLTTFLSAAYADNPLRRYARRARAAARLLQHTWHAWRRCTQAHLQGLRLLWERYLPSPPDEDDADVAPEVRAALLLEWARRARHEHMDAVRQHQQHARTHAPHRARGSSSGGGGGGGCSGWAGAAAAAAAATARRGGKHASREASAAQTARLYKALSHARAAAPPSQPATLASRAPTQQLPQQQQQQRSSAAASVAAAAAAAAAAQRSSYTRELRPQQQRPSHDGQRAARQRVSGATSPPPPPRLRRWFTPADAAELHARGVHLTAARLAAPPRLRYRTSLQ